MSESRRSEIAAILSRAMKRQRRNVAQHVDDASADKTEEVVVVDMGNERNEEPEAGQ